MTAVKLTPAQLRVLCAVADGKVSRRISYPYGWHAADSDGVFAPRAVTCDALLDRGLISLDFDHADHRWVAAEVTAAGRVLLDSNPETKGQP